MTQQELILFIENFHSINVEIIEKKNSDYTADDEDALINFKSVEAVGVPAEMGFITRMMDKMSRISAFAIKGQLQVKDESVKDTLQDLANYCALFAAYLESKKEAK